MLRTGRTTLALWTLLWLAASTSARAQVCSEYCGMYVEGRCVEYRQSCTTPEAPPRPSFGAIAYGRSDGSWGSSYHWGSQQKAEKVAIDTCAKQGAKDCEVQVWFDRRCGAIVAGEDRIIVWGVDETEGGARGDAQKKCASAGNKACQMLASACSR